MNPPAVRAHASVFQRFISFMARLAHVSAVPVGSSEDGLWPIMTGGTEFDRPWADRRQEFSDATDAWRQNALARRIIGLITAYVVGDGITLSSTYRPLSNFVSSFFEHPLNKMLLREAQWCAELSRSGELFVTLHTNPADGMSYVRAIPAGVIDAVTWRPGDYETELTYHEVVPPNDPDYANGGRTWLSPNHAEADSLSEDGAGVAGRPRPLMLHFAVNRPVGCVRGESDLAPILVWLKRYSSWLEDRARLNEILQSFVWVLKVARGTVPEKEAKYRLPPEPGSVVIVEQGDEDWQAVTPNLNAADAASDGKAIRWQIAAGSPGLALVDFGEADDANLATATAMSEQRWRFMAERQAYFGYVLAQTVLTAYNRAVRLGMVRGREQAVADIRIHFPDVASEDNAQLAAAARGIAEALAVLQNAGFSGPTFKRLALHTVLQFAGETVSDDDIEAMLLESEDAVTRGRGDAEKNGDAVTR